MTIWKKRSHEEIKNTIFNALGKNVNYYQENILGIPASHLDDRVFYQDAPFLKDAPYLSTLIHNPNHIGCHTLGASESFFKGTQEIEQQVIRICAEDILKGAPKSQDGYVAAGGTEANMQAVWIYRNYFMQEHNADINEICLITSVDGHYSSNKAADVLNLDIAFVEVGDISRKVKPGHLEKVLGRQQANGKKYFIVIVNMMTTMFGSVDDPDVYVKALKKAGVQYKIHVDGAFGGFFYPFATTKNKLDFNNAEVSSITLDAHKMLQAPYGTGLFLIRKGYMRYTITQQASYIEGQDFTLIGSRSGANAVAIWMILMTYGPNGWYEKILILNNRTDWLEKQLNSLKLAFFRESGSNIITLKYDRIKDGLARQYGLVPDNHSNPSWYKIVVMDHVTIEKLTAFIEDLSATLLRA